MELTIEQALQQGVAAHKDGKLQEAERLYRTILQSQPLHPDANHNLGVLAVTVNKAAAALPLFKTALEANPETEQFWLSYLDALIINKQFDTAEKVVEKGKKNGISDAKLARFIIEKNTGDQETIIEEIPNYLAEEDFSRLYDEVNRLPWVLHKKMNSNSSEDHHFQFMQDYSSGHFRKSFEGLEKSIFTAALAPYCKKHKITAELQRVRTNLYVRTIEYQDGCGFHEDFELAGCFTLLLYLENSNGATEFEDSGKRIISERNKAIIFPANMSHQTILQTDTLFRMNLNVNFFKS